MADLKTDYVQNNPDPASALNATNTRVNELDAGKMSRAPRVVTLTASSNTYTPALSTTDVALITNPAADSAIAAPVGTPYDSQRLMFRIKSNGTGRVMTFNSGSYMSSGIAALPTAALPANKTVKLFFMYDSVATKFVLDAADLVGY